MADVIDIHEKQWAVYACPSCGLRNFARAEPQHRGSCGKCKASLENARQIGPITTTSDRPRMEAPAAGLASLGERFWARLLDNLIGFAIVFSIYLATESNALLIAVSIAGGIVNEYVLVVLRGQQVGKMILGLRIVDAESRGPINTGSAVIRGLVYVFPLSPFWALWDIRNQGLHDKAAKTIVVDERRG